VAPAVDQHRLERRERGGILVRQHHVLRRAQAVLQEGGGAMPRVPNQIVALFGCSDETSIE
jgi:hypothetical protein